MKTSTNSLAVWGRARGQTAETTAPQAKKTTKWLCLKMGSILQMNILMGHMRMAHWNLGVSPQFLDKSKYGGRCLKPAQHHSAEPKQKPRWRIDLIKTPVGPSLFFAHEIPEIGCPADPSSPWDLQVNQAHVLFELLRFHIVVDGPAVAVLPRPRGQGV